MAESEQTLNGRQRWYQHCFIRLSQLKRDGQDNDDNPIAALTRDALYKCWIEMTKEEKKPFLAPQCLDRHHDGPINRDFVRGKLPKQFLDIYPKFMPLRCSGVEEVNPSQENAVKILEDQNG